MFSDEVTSESRPSCKEAVVNGFAEGRFGWEPSCSMEDVAKVGREG